MTLPRWPARVRITEVGPRDGLQNEPRTISTPEKVRFVDALSAAGFAEIEVSSFVSPSWIPQLADAAEVFSHIHRRPGVVYSALVPNEKGLERALAAHVDKVSVFVSASEGFSLRNINCTIDESLQRLAPVVAMARSASKPVRGYLSCVVRCPFDGATPGASVRRVAEALLNLGVDEIDLGETLGVAVPDDIDRVLEAVDGLLARSATTLHLHDTRRTALACAYRALQLGITSFDTSAGGLGGCPYAPGARGNMATEDLLYLLSGCGIESGVDPLRLAEAAAIGQAARGERANS